MVNATIGAGQKSAVIFDMDGVLLRTDEYHYQSWVEMSKAYGIPFDRELFDQRMRGLERPAALAVFLKSAGEVIPADVQGKMIAEKQERFLAIVRREGVEPLPGVVELLVDLRRHGAKIGVGSSSRNTRLLLEAAGLAERVDAVVDANQCRGKPEPDIFLAVAHALDTPAEQCVVVEDAVDGIEAARRAKMATLAVGPRERFGDVPYCVPSLVGVTAEWVLGLRGS
jgi:beta-phosphoglucomutase